MNVKTSLRAFDPKHPYREAIVLNDDAEYRFQKEILENLRSFEASFYSIFPKKTLSWKVEKKDVDNTYELSIEIRD